MNIDEFVEKYSDLVKLVTNRIEKATKNGLLSLEDDLDLEKIHDRDILEYGIMLVCNGYDAEVIKEILFNIISQEKDEYMRLFKNIQSEAVYCINIGCDIKLTYYILNSLSGFSFKDDPMKDFVEGKTKRLFPK